MRRLSIVLAAASVAAQPPGRSPRNHGPGHRNHPRPSCDAYMQRHHGLADGRFLTRAKGTWHMRDDGSRAYDVAPCRVVRYTAENARRCLKNRHLLFVGDSLTRYTSTSLVHFLERSEWPKRFPADVPRCRDPATDAQREACDSGPNVCAEGSWQREPGGAWPAMLAHIGGGADGSLFNGRMECICARGKAMKTNPKDGSSATVQNYLYRGAAVNVTFITQTGWTGTEQLQGWKSSGCAEKGECRFSVEAHAENIERANRFDYDWEAPITEALGVELPRLFPDVTDAFYNRGLWGPLLPKVSKDVFAALRKLTKLGGRCFWRGTTAEKEERATALTAQQAGCESFDAQKVTEEFHALPFFHPLPEGPFANHERRDVYWDAVHFMPWVYEELNNLLLNVLCNSDTTWERA